MSELPGDCGGPPPFSKAYTGHTVFLVRVVHVDRITGAMAVVQQRFAALPWWNKIVFLKFIQKKGTYFVDGRFEEGLVTRWLVPVLDLKCTGSSTIENAGVELRLFRDSPRWNGVRLIGRVSNAPTAGTGLTPAPGVTVVVDGPNSVETVTDRDGIYDVSGLPPGHYSIRVLTSSRHEDCEYRGEAGLNAGDVWGCELLTNSPE
jgi:Carboxypeptidase regulatory-like domain